MKLDLKQIRAVTFGTANVTEEVDGFHFFRFTEAQKETYRNASSDFYKKTFATSNVTIEFFTDSKTLSLDVTYTRASSRAFAFVDVWCNGDVISHLGSGELPEGRYGNTFSLGEGKKELRLCFPWSACTVLNALELDDGAEVIPAKKSCRMLIFGDSITQGYDATYPSHAYTSILAARLNADARNKGIGGELFFPPLLDESEKDFDPDIITVAYGTNDWSKAKEAGEVEPRMTEFYSLLSCLYPRAQIFALAPIWRKTDGLVKPTGPFSVMEPMVRRATAALPNVTVIPGMDLVPHDPTYFSDLHLHPNDAGFAFYGERLADAIECCLKK